MVAIFLTTMFLVFLILFVPLVDRFMPKARD